MEELSATFSPHLSESDRASVYNQITENTNNLRKLDSEVLKKRDHLSSDIEEVNLSFPKILLYDCYKKTWEGATLLDFAHCS